MEYLISCEYKFDDDWNQFIITFNTAVSLYTNHIWSFIPELTRKCASILLKTTRLTKDSFNASILHYSKFRQSNQKTQPQRISSPTQTSIFNIRTMVNKANEKINKNQTGTEGKSELKKILGSLDESRNKGQVEIKPNGTFNVIQALKVLSGLKVDHLRSSFLI